MVRFIANDREHFHSRQDERACASRLVAMGRRKRPHGEAAPAGLGAVEDVGSQLGGSIPTRNAILSIMVAAASPESGRLGRHTMEWSQTMGGKVAGDVELLGRMGTASGGSGDSSCRQQNVAEAQHQEDYRRTRDYWMARGGWRNRSSGTTSNTQQTGAEASEPKSWAIENPRRGMGNAITRRKQSTWHAAEKSEELSDPGEDDGDGYSQEEVNREENETRGSLDKAVELAKKPRELKRAKETFVKRFLAANTLAAKNSKRGKVMEIAVAAGCGKVFPLTRDIITLVGTALDEAKIQSGDQYINELKLMHIEDGHNWSAPLERQLFLVKLALKRHKGPEQRAHEVRPEDFDVLTWEARCSKYRGHQRPAWSYAFACVWMLRAAEMVRVRVKHVRLDHLTKTVSLHIPFSKMDQRGKGATRTLTCMCWDGRCNRWCAWGLAVMALAEHTVVDGEAMLFKGVNKKGKSTVSKAQMVSGWKRDVDDKITGHSARRSGAMHYTREGLDVATISFLGRWRSSAVLRYIEEALSQMPINIKKSAGETADSKKGMLGKDQPVAGDNIETEPMVTKETVVHEKVVKFVKDKNAIIIPGDPDEEDMWAISNHSRGRVAHVVTKASWGLDLDEWQTHCGWHFAQRFVKVQLVRRPPKTVKVCSKCGAAREQRDRVKGGCNVAQLMAKTLAHETST